MILLDTNVVSETMKPKPNAGVMEWLNDQDLDSLWLPVITVMGLRFGAALLEPGPRRRALESRIDDTVDKVFGGRIKHLDDPAVRISRIGRQQRGGMAGESDSPMRQWRQLRLLPDSASPPGTRLRSRIWALK